MASFVNAAIKLRGGGGTESRETPLSGDEDKDEDGWPTWMPLDARVSLLENVTRELKSPSPDSATFIDALRRFNPGELERLQELHQALPSSAPIAPPLMSSSTTGHAASIFLSLNYSYNNVTKTNDWYYKSGNRASWSKRSKPCAGGGCRNTAPAQKIGVNRLGGGGRSV